jgi:Phage derived protein Gp49-like (DUF891)
MAAPLVQARRRATAGELHRRSGTSWRPANWNIRRRFAQTGPNVGLRLDLVANGDTSILMLPAMEFTVEFYETNAGRRLVEEFLLKLKASDPDDFTAVVAGLAKLRHRRNHREPLSKALTGGLFELRHVGKLNTRIIWFFVKGRRIVARSWNP